MDSTQFAYWLQGFFELSGSTSLTAEQVAMIKKHLALVFMNVTSNPKFVLQDPQQGFKLPFEPICTAADPNTTPGVEVIC